jgi:hypothetical protein
MKLHQVNQGRGEQRLPEPASTTSASVAGVVDGTLEQTLHFKRTYRYSAKNKGYTITRWLRRREAALLAGEIRNNTGKA